ncbi:aldehyde dehydrogenase family protein [Dactylosporangium sp. NPDC050688]|uniref:aldehyde dehydrogenase family protein n=1 Tax=Dactylosporangium sp. NPDC050688 TaxID=3157217 RepID=UPI0033CFD872
MRARVTNSPGVDRPDLSTLFAATADGIDVPTTATFAVLNPATEHVVGYAPSVTPDQLDGVFAAAERACQPWQSDEGARRQALHAAADAIDAATDELSGLLTAEQGKPLAEARSEFTRAAVWLRYFADLQLGHEDVPHLDGRAAVQRRPLGVVAAITPWNVPLVLAVWKIAPALRAGNTMVLKPSPFTPLTTLAVGHLLRRVLPAGVLNIIAGPDPLGAALVAHPTPRKVSFTGSTATGIKVAQAAAAGLKRVTLELGGNDPAIIFDDVDVTAIAETLFWNAFTNNGQICRAVKRVYAHESIHAELVEALATIAASTKVGDGSDPAVRLGPLNNPAQRDRVAELVRDALDHGATVAAGGRQPARPGYFYEPTILDNVTDGVRVVDEEQFGPVLPVVAFRDTADVIRSANRGPYGLTASVWSNDLDRARAVADQLDAGQVSLNVHGGGVVPHLPFGGHKLSGIGVENGPWGLDAYCDLRVITSAGR